MSPLQEFQARLSACGADFEWQDAGCQDAGQAQVRCIGPFQGEPVIWAARIMTLTQAAAMGAAQAGSRQYIEIAPAQGDVRRVDIALAVPSIDLPVIRKALVMLRQYKRLAEGRHEFGPSVPSNSPDSPV